MFPLVTTPFAYGGPGPITYGEPFMSLLEFVLQLAGPISPNFTPPVPTQRCQVSDGGVSLIIQLLDSVGNPVNLRLASSFSILLVRPSGVETKMKAAYYTNGFDGRMVIVSGSMVPSGTGLDEAGMWMIQGQITISGNTQFSEIGSFSVGNNLGA